MTRRLLIPFALAAFAVVSLAACGGEDSASGGSGKKITLVAYSTPREAYEAIIPAFQKTAEGEGVDFEQSYAASGEQSRAVESGLPADFVAFSLEPDVTRLVDADLVDANWAEDEYNGMVTDSVVVFAVRPGNPKNIHTWDDLLQEGLEVITPNPFTSGGAQWNIMAAYGAQLEQGKTRGGGRRVPARALPEQRAGAGQERARGAPDVPRRQGRRAPRLRERGALRQEQGPGRSTTSSPTRRS